MYESTATVYIDVTNRAPSAADDSHATTHDQSFSGSPHLLANDSDPDGDAVEVVGVNGGSGNVGVAVGLPSGATVTVNANGTFTYVPATGYVGVDSFTYTISDGFAESTASVYVDVTNQAPTAQDDSHQTLRDQTLYGSPYLLANDTDGDGDTLTVAKVNGSSASVGVPITLASGATLTVNADGSFTYVPPSGFVGQDSFTYTITDGIAESMANVFITVLAS